MLRQVTFSSETKLDDSVAKQTAGESSKEQECNIMCDGRDNDMEASGKPGVLGRIINFFGSLLCVQKSFESCKSSGGDTASAVREQMDCLTPSDPSSNTAVMESSCDTGIAAINLYEISDDQSSGCRSSLEYHPLKLFKCSLVGGSGPGISVKPKDEPEVTTHFDG
jgi:hypothetical protein